MLDGKKKRRCDKKENKGREWKMTRRKVWREGQEKGMKRSAAEEMDIKRRGMEKGREREGKTNTRKFLKQVKVEG